MYTIVLDRKATAMDLKAKLGRELGFGAGQVLVYSKNLLVQDMVFLAEMQGFDAEEDILLCITLGLSSAASRSILRQPTLGIRVADVLAWTTKQGERLSPDELSPEGKHRPKFDIDSASLEEPPFVSFGDSNTRLTLDIGERRAQLQGMLDSLRDRNWGEAAAVLAASPALAALAAAEAQYSRLQETFADAAVNAVHYAVQSNAPSLNLHNLFGEGGDIFAAGGLLARRAKNWTVCGKDLSDDQPQVVKGQAGTSVDVNQVTRKVATLEVRALALLRHRIPRLIVPLACIVDYYGICFEVMSPSLLTLDTLVYGSDTDGLLFKDDDEDAELLAAEIGRYFNIQPYEIRERATGVVKRAYLPYAVRLHRDEAESHYYIVNAHRLIPSEEPASHKAASKYGAVITASSQ